MLNIDQIKDFFILENSHAKKELGQNFLIDLQTINNIVDSLEIKKGEKVLEIGPGLGALTCELVKKDINLTCVEYDQKFVNFLNKNFESKNNITIIKNSILHFKDFSFEKIIGNLPYYITTDILEYIFKNFRYLNEAVFMVQNEALNRILALTGKDYNAINVLIGYRYDIKKIFNVSKNNFFPVPNVDSVVFKINIKENTDFNFSIALLKVTKILFKFRRKTIYNNLKVIVSNIEQLTLLLERCGLSSNLRPEQLKIDDFIKITNELIEKNLLRINNYGRKSLFKN